MAWAKFDDMLPSNRKWRRVVKRSPEAACLWVAAICYSARYLTDGRIEKDELDEVAPLRKPKAAAAVLVAEGLFEDHGEVYYVHDYLQWNPPAAEVLAKREEERERKAAQRAKGSKNAGRGADGQFVPQGVPEGVPPGHPPGQDVGHPPGHPSDVQEESHQESQEVSSATRPVPSQSSSSSSDSRPPPGAGGRGSGYAEKAEAAAAVVAERRLRATTGVANPESWKRATAKQVLAEAGDGIAATAERYPDLTPDELATCAEGGALPIRHRVTPAPELPPPPDPESFTNGLSAAREAARASRTSA